VRDRCITAALNDEEVAALDLFREAHSVISMPTRSAFVAWIIRQWIEANRRKDVPCMAPKRVPQGRSKILQRLPPMSPELPD
jgi:hypothetical protein